MATTLYQGNSGITTRHSLSSLYNKTFDAIAEKKSKMVLEGGEFFAERTTNLETYKEGEISGVYDVPQRVEDTDRIPLLTPIEGYNQTWTQYTRKSGIILTEDAIKMQKTTMIAKVLKGLPESANALTELAYNQMFTNGFASETAGDGSYLFATDHNHEDPQFGAWTNTPASGGDFTTDTYLAAWTSLQNRTNEKDFPTPMIPETVYYPTAIHEAVMKVAGSEKYPQNSLNAKMPELFGNFVPKQGHWLTSATAWFVHAKVDESDKGMVIVWRQKPNYKPLSDGMNPDLVMGKRLKMAFGIGALHARDWYANAGV